MKKGKDLSKRLKEIIKSNNSHNYYNEKRNEWRLEYYLTQWINNRKDVII